MSIDINCMHPFYTGTCARWAQVPHSDICLKAKNTFNENGRFFSTYNPYQKPRASLIKKYLWFPYLSLLDCEYLSKVPFSLQFLKIEKHIRLFQMALPLPYHTSLSTAWEYTKKRGPRKYLILLKLHPHSPFP